MASQSPPKKNAAYTFDISVWSQADSTALKSGPTIAAGDFKISTDGSALANLANLPTATGVQITIVLTSGEMNGDRVFIYWQDASGAEWIAGYIVLMTSARLNDDLAFPTVSGRSIVVDASGLVDANAVKVGPSGAGTAQTTKDLGASITQTGDSYARLGAPQGASTAADIAAIQSDTDNLQTRIPAALDANGFMKADVEDWKGATAPANTGDAFARLGAPAGASVSADVAAVQADTDNIQTRLPAALVSGRMDASVGAMAAAVQTTASFAVGAIDNTVIGTSGAVEIADAFLDRDMSTGTDSGSPTVRTPRQALRVLRNKVDIPNGKVKKEDDTTDSWTFTTSTAPGDPVTVVDPA